VNDAREGPPLIETLRDGLGVGDTAQTARALGLALESQPQAVARALVAVVATQEIARVELRAERRLDPRPSVQPSLVTGADSSFLGQLGTGGDSSGLVVSALDDVRTLLAVLRAGKLRQRRAAVRRLGEILGKSHRGVPSEDLRRATEVLTHLRDVELARELSDVRAHLPGVEGREVRAERDQFLRLSRDLERRVAAFWDAELADEPIAALPGDQRAMLMLRVVELSDTLAFHLGAIVEGIDGVSSRDARLSLVTSLRHAGDGRLVPALRVVLEREDPDLRIAAARALGRIDDPRVHPALVSAYDRSVVDLQRTVIAGALGLAGDARGAEYARHALESEDGEVRVSALEALEAVGGTEDWEAVARLLEVGDPRTCVHAVRALARLGDARALGPLRQLREKTGVSAMWAEVEDAVAAIAARLELRGEEVDAESTALRISDGVEALAVRQAPAAARLWSYKDYLFGQLWLALGGHDRAVARFERAAARRPDWGAPLVAIGMLHARHNRYSKALASFRQVAEVDRRLVERHPIVLRTLLRCFLRRAEEVERDGRGDIARGLLEEALSMDLRRAPSALAFEVRRRHEGMRV